MMSPDYAIVGCILPEDHCSIYTDDLVITLYCAITALFPAIFRASRSRYPHDSFVTVDCDRFNNPLIRFSDRAGGVKPAPVINRGLRRLSVIGGLGKLAVTPAARFTRQMLSAPIAQLPPQPKQNRLRYRIICPAQIQYTSGFDIAVRIAMIAWGPPRSGFTS